MSIANPIKTWAATIQAGVGIGNSGSFTFTINLTQAWQVAVPVIVRPPANVSAGPQINVYRSQDGGNSFDTVPIQPLGLVRMNSSQAAFQQASLKLETGQYAIQVLVGGGSTATWTVQVLTQEYLTAIQNI